MPEPNLYTVVVADDEDELREAVCRMTPWESLGFRLVGSASNGLDALELVEQREPDLLLTDIRMPFISGIELARQVREIRPSMSIAFLSGYDDFEYAKQAIQYNIISYMLKPLTIEGLSKELRRIHGVIDQQFEAFREQGRQQADRAAYLMSLVLDDFSGGPAEDAEQALRTAAAEAGFLQPGDDKLHFVVMVMSIPGEGGPCTAQAALAERLGKKYLRTDSFCTGSRVVSVLGGNPSDFEEYLHILADELVQVTRRVLQKSCVIGVSRETARLSGLHGAYREAMEAFSYGEPGQSDIRFISDIQPMTAAHVDSLTDRVAQVETAFKSGARQELETALAALLEEARSGQCGKNWLDTAALQLISDIYRTLYAVAGPEAMTELQNRALLPDVGLRYHSAQELCGELSAFCTCAMDLLSSQQKKGGSLICQRALDAIDANFGDEGLSLNSLSALLGVSPNHLSACIKKYEGESFINILIRKRMEAARQLLLTTPLKIAEVAQRCGYSDQHYFSYCFKKYCGVSPIALRRQAEAERNGGAG